MRLNFLQPPWPTDPASPEISVPCSDDGCIDLPVSGPDAQAFLQGQLTIDVNQLQPGQTQIAALCNPQGRVSAMFDVLRLQDQFVLVLPLSIAGAVAAQLQRYVMRSRVVLGPPSESGTIRARFDPGLKLPRGECSGQPDNFVYHPSWLADGWQFAKQPDRDARADELHLTWPQARLLWGHPAPVLQTQDLFLPQMLNLDKLDGVSYNKGCYTGQEIIARIHFRGTVKRRLFRYVIDAAVAAGTEPQLTAPVVTSDGANAGTVVAHAVDDLGNVAILAVIKIDMTERPLYYGAAELQAWPLA